MGYNLLLDHVMLVHLLLRRMRHLLHHVELLLLGRQQALHLLQHCSSTSV
jgi:hypothetical protein